MNSRKPLCEVVGDKEKHESKEDSVTIELPTTKPVSVNVTIKQGEQEPKQESTQGRKQLLG